MGFLHRIQPLALAFAAVILEPVVSISNQQDAVLILTSLCCLMFAASITSTNSAARPLAAAVVLLGLCMPLEGCIYELVGLAFSAQHEARHWGAPGVPRLDGPGLSSVVFEGEFPGIYKYENGPPLVNAVNDGIHLLQANTGPRDRVLTLGFSNPFPSALRRPSPRGAATFFSLGMTISHGNYLPAAGLFAEVEVVMVPTYETEESGTTRAMVAQYKDVLENDYILARQSPISGFFTESVPPESDYFQLSCVAECRALCNCHFKAAGPASAERIIHLAEEQSTDHGLWKAGRIGDLNGHVTAQIPHQVLAPAKPRDCATVDHVTARTQDGDLFGQSKTKPI